MPAGPTAPTRANRPLRFCVPAGLEMTKLHGLGHIDGKTHILPISVYYEDTDLSGFVYHANYLRYMERGRTEFFRTANINRTNQKTKKPTTKTIRHIDVDYHRPARLDDQIEVHTT